MQPSSSFPGSPSPSNKSPNLRRPIALLAIVLVVGLIVLFIGVFQMLRGVQSAPRQASGPYATATTSDSSTATNTASGTPVLGATPSPTSSTGNPGTQTGAVRVTQNQDERQACLDDPVPYIVVLFMLFNGGNVTANWHVYVPAVYGAVSGGPIALSQPLASPRSSYPYWADPNPQDGSIAPGQMANFAMTVRYGMPCGSTLYKAAVQLHFPAGTSQADIALTFGGTGPTRYSNVVLVSGSLNMTQACPVSGVAPDPFTFAIKNTGNFKAYPYFDTSKDTVSASMWATIPSITADPNAPDTHWLYPDETWIVTVVPRAGVLCDGTGYRVFIYSNNAQGTTQTMILTDTFQ